MRGRPRVERFDHLCDPGEPPRTDAERRALEDIAFALPGPKTLDMIGRHLGVSRERVRQIEVEAMRKLRLRLNPEWLDVLADIEGTSRGEITNISLRG